ncbi:MAG: alpha/beta fold hydrolase [Dechloromonas sp.]|uniref:Alpha/beta fold hydrolase n=1 Tax=Candidatus Dechloromonas phosphorivorans TaxID=2899244 RepID=A0A935K1C0_9RHOO|nr:alpha/beta fold hydrolase [Candidatus Dechloromonas phosphorivorans]
MIKTEKIDGLEVFSCKPARKTGQPTLLFVHGAFAGAWMWTETFMPVLAEAGYPCYAVSLRGHGGSDGRGSYRLAFDQRLLSMIWQSSVD